MKRYLVLLLTFFLVCSELPASQVYFTKAELRSRIEELLNYHVEHKELSPLVIRRSIKIFIEQFDPYRQYLLNEEVKPYFELSDAKIHKVIKQIYAGDYSLYEELLTLIRSSIDRSRAIRKSLYDELQFQRINQEDLLIEAALYYSYSEEHLKQRIKKNILNFLDQELKWSRSALPIEEKKERVFKLWEEKLESSEKKYTNPGKGTSKRIKEEDSFCLLVLKSIAKSLDAHTTYFTWDEAKLMRSMLEKEFEGVGVFVRQTIDGAIVTDLVKGSPAEKAGCIRPGDLLIKVDEQDMTLASFDDVLSALEGKGKKKLTLTFCRLDSNSLVYEVELPKQTVILGEERLRYTAEPYQDGWIGLIDLPSFYASSDGTSCDQDLLEAIRALKAKGKLYGVVLDLRENSGGFLTQAVKVVGLFISSGVVVISKTYNDEVQYHREIDGRIYYDGPLVVLTSKASASAAEIVAQALQDYGAAVVVGDERTYGKGTIQYQTVTQDTGPYFKVTVGKYYTVSGRSTQIEGVKADIVVPTHYFPFNIGEKYLEYPLRNDYVTPAYMDSLDDLDEKTQVWFKRHYLPYLHQPENKWKEIVPSLQANSEKRLKSNVAYIKFQKALHKARESGEYDINPQSFSNEDLCLEEATNILKDMILESDKRALAVNE